MKTTSFRFLRSPLIVVLISAMAFLTACGGVGTGTGSNPPTATPNPTATSVPTTNTPVPNTPTKVPNTLVPPTNTPTAPALNMIITAPAMHTSITSPVHVTGRARNIFEGQFLVNVRDSTGRVLGQVNAYVTGNSDSWQNWAVDVPFTYLGNAAPGAIAAFDLSAKDGSVIDQASIPVTIATVQPTVNMIINTPAMHATVTSPVNVTGKARNIFEGQFTVQVRDSAGNVLGQSAATVLGNTSVWQTWSVSIAFKYTGATVGSITAFDLSAKDGSVIDQVSIPVTVQGTQPLVGNIVITGPAMHSTINKVVRVTGKARNIFEGRFVVNVRDSQGHVLGQANVTIEGMASGWQNWAVDVPFTFTGNQAAGAIAAFDYSAKDGSVIDQVSIPVTLQGPTLATTIVINSPAFYSTVHSPIHVTGHARNVYNNTFVVQIRDIYGNVLGQKTIYAGGPTGSTTWQTWSADIPYAHSGAPVAGFIVGVEPTYRYVVDTAVACVALTFN